MPWYKQGLVNVTQNSNAVIGAGTAFLANSRVGDAFRGPDGAWYEVINIASDTAMAIAPNYQGATNTTGIYALAPMQGYVKDSADSLRALVNQFGGVLAVLGETPTTEGVRDALNLENTDGLPEGTINKYMSAAGVRAVPLAGLEVLTPGAVTSSDTILSAIGKLQATKAGKGVNTDITQLTGLTSALSIAQGGTGANTAASARAALGLVILGTVGQSGGAPTGALMEYGSNANGEYWKFASGLMICSAVKSVITTINSALGGLFWKGTADRAADSLPATFAVPPFAAVIIGGEYPGISCTVSPPTTGTFGVIRHMSPLALPLATYSYTYIAIGRWF